MPGRPGSVLWDRRRPAYKAVVADADAVRVDHCPAQPNATVDEFHECDEALRKHPDVIAALAGAGSPTCRWC